MQALDDVLELPAFAAGDDEDSRFSGDLAFSLRLQFPDAWDDLTRPHTLTDPAFTMRARPSTSFPIRTACLKRAFHETVKPNLPRKTMHAHAPTSSASVATRPPCMMPGGPWYRSLGVMRVTTSSPSRVNASRNPIA